MESKGTLPLFQTYLAYLNDYISRKLSKLLQDIEKGNHDDKACEEYYAKYKIWFGQELPDCQFKGNNSKIKNLIRRVHVDEDPFPNFPR